MAGTPSCIRAAASHHSGAVGRSAQVGRALAPLASGVHRARVASLHFPSPSVRVPLPNLRSASGQKSAPASDGDRDLELLDKLAAARVALDAQIARRVIGQREVVDNLLASILAGGHALLVGVP